MIRAAVTHRPATPPLRAVRAKRRGSERAVTSGQPPGLSQGEPEGGSQDTLQECGDCRPRSVAAPITAGKCSGATCGRAGSARGMACRRSRSSV